MGIKSNSVLASYFNRFGATGKDAVDPAPVPVYTEATGGVISDYEISGSYYRTHVFTSSGTFTVTKAGTDPVEYIVVGGGGGANCEGGGGGGGAGGYLTSPLTVSTSPGSYAIQIGAGGQHIYASDSVAGLPGSPSYFTAPIIAYGGGGGASKKPAGVGGPGGSGGGDGGPSQQTAPGYGYNPTTPSPVLPTALQPLHPYPLTQGYPGGTGAGAQPNPGSAGGGGAGGVGGNGANNTGGAGGIGIQVPATFRNPTKPFGTPGPDPAGMYVAGGGGGSTDSPTGGTAGTGGYGGGGAGGWGLDPGAPHAVSPDAGTNGTQSTGGGGGATDDGWGYYWSGNGGSGIAAIVYEIESSTGTAKATGGSVSYYGGKTIHTFTNSGTFATGPTWTSATVEYIVVAGGGGANNEDLGGAGGAGGYLTGTTPIGAHPVSTTVQIGAGGQTSYVDSMNAANGGPSYFGSPITATGGGGGAAKGGDPTGNPGGSGGGGDYGPRPGGSGVGGQGNDGGDGAGPPTASGGGGGAGGAGGNGSASPKTGGAGGIGVQAPTTFRDPDSSVGTPGPGPSAYWFAGGGGGCTDGPGTGGAGGAGGGGTGGYDPGGDGSAGTQNTGGGGGATDQAAEGDRVSGNGGSGIVLVAYPT